MKRDLEEIIKPALQNPIEHKMTTHDWKKHDASHICDIYVRLLQESEIIKLNITTTRLKNLTVQRIMVVLRKPAAQKDQIQKVNVSQEILLTKQLNALYAKETKGRKN